jgi:RNA recognition motif-containing protein
MQLFVSNIPYTCTIEAFDKQIKNFVADATTRLIMKPDGQNNKGFGFVTIPDAQMELGKSLIDAVGTGVVVDGRRLKFTPYVNQQKFYKLHISNIPEGIKEQELFEVFSTYGKLDNVKVDFDYKTKQSRGTACVVYTNYEDFSKVLQLGEITIGTSQVKIVKRRLFKRRQNTAYPVKRQLKIERPKQAV